MNENLKIKLLRITEKLIEDPLSKKFSNINLGGKSFLFTMRLNVQRKNDFNSIKNLLINNEYTDINKWKEDIENVWLSFEKNCKEKELIYYKSLKWKLNKLIEKEFLFNISKWSEKIYQLNKNYNKLLISIPLNLKNILEKSEILIENNLNDNIKFENYNNFINKFEKIKNQNLIQEILEIIKLN